MKRSIQFIVVLFLVCWSNVAFAKKRLAVLEFRGIGLEQTMLFQLSDEARGGAREGLPIQDYDITSRENIKQMLEDMGKTIEECDVECEVELGRVVGADYVLSGNVYQVEGNYILTLKLHDTVSGSLLSQKRIQSKTQLDMLQETYTVSRSMIANCGELLWDCNCCYCAVLTRR
jgi:hypothetical protein